MIPTERTVILSGKNVSIVTMSVEDQASFFQWLSTDEELRKMIDIPNVPTMEDQMKWFDRLQTPDQKMLSIVVQSDQELVGNGGFVKIDRESLEAEFRITIGNRPYRGKGLGKEASELLLKFGFENLGLRKVRLHVLRKNTRAVALYHALGFEKIDSNAHKLFMELSREHRLD